MGLLAKAEGYSSLGVRSLATVRLGSANGVSTLLTLPIIGTRLIPPETILDTRFIKTPHYVAGNSIPCMP